MRHSGCKRTGSGMGIFRRSSAAPAPALDPAAALADCLRAIAAHEAPEDALQPALQAILEATGTQAGALCLFDAASGAHDVPPLVEGGAAVCSVACVPLCAGETPLGSLVLVARAPRALSEHDVEQLAGPLAEVVRMIETARRPRAGTAAPEPEPSGAVASLDGPGGEVAAGSPEPASLAAKLAARSEEADRLRAALEAAERETAELSVALERSGSGSREAVEQAGAAEAARAA